jgi:hypothetical protein
MLSLDLFNSQYEKKLHEGAVDSTIEHLLKPLNLRAAEIRTQLRGGRLDPKKIDQLEKEYEDLVQRRLDIMFDRQPQTEQQQPQQPPAKGLLKGKDLITPQQRVAGATPQKPGVGGAVRDVVGGVKRWLQGKDDIGPTYESVTEQDDISKQSQPVASSVSGEVILQTLANAWDQKYPYVDLPFNPVATVSRPKIYDILVALKQMNDTKMRTLVNDVFKDRSNFLLWSSNLKRRPTPVEKPKTLPGQMKLFKETDGQKKNSKSQDQVNSPQNLAVQRYLQQVRRKHPAAASDIEAIAKDEIEQQSRTDQTIKDLKAVNRRQDVALKKAQSLDRQQGDEINDIENQIDQLAQKMQIIKKGKPADGVDVNAPAKSSQRLAQPSVSTNKPTTTQAVTPKQDREVTAPAAAVIPVTDKALSDKLQNLEKQVQQARQQGDPENKVQSLLTQLDQAQKALNKQIASLGTMQQKSDSSKQGLIDLFPQEKPTAKVKPKAKIKTPKLDLTKQDEPEDLSLAKGLLSKYRTPAEVNEHGGGIGPKQHWQDLMQETVTDVRPLWADVYRRLAPKIERHRDSFLAGQLYDELENIAELHSAEGEFKRMMNGARNRAHMEYDTNPGGFQNWFWFLPFEDESLDEIDRRGFLKGLGATAGLAAMGGVKAATSPDDPSWRKVGQPFDNSVTTSDQVKQVAGQQPTLSSRIANVKGPNAKGEYLVTVIHDDDIVSDYVTKTPPKSWMQGTHKAYPQVEGMAEGTEDIKKRMSKLEALALAANRAGDDAKCKMYQQKIQSLKQKLSQSMAEAVNEKGALKSAQAAAKFIIRNLDDRAALKDYSMHFWSPEKFYQGATMAMRGAGYNEIVQHITQDRPAQFESGVAEGWSDAMVSRRTGTLRTPYAVYIKGKKWKDFENEELAQAVADKLRAKFKADGRDPETITIAPADMSEGVKSSAAATALAACIAAGGTLSGCATNPSVGGTIGTVRDVGTAAKTASTMTRAGVQDELGQELRNFIRAQGGDPGSQNLSLLYKLQKRLQGQKEPQQPLNEIKDTEAVEQAILKRIMVAHKDMLIKYGPEKIMTAASDVAYNVGDIGEMGSSDISGWVNQVEQILGAVNETKTRLDPKCWTGKKIGNPKTKVKGGVRVNNCVPAESVEEGLKDPADNPCWKGYKPVGTKNKGGKTVPNCVPKTK